MNIKDIRLEIQEVKEHNDFLQRQNNALRLELQRIKSMGMFEFANEFCSEDQLEDAGHAFARSLGVGVHDDIIAENEFVANGEALYEATWNINCGDDF